MRVNAVLGLYFDPDNDLATKAAMREEYVRALATYPDWAVHQAFDAWVKTGQRRPSPGEIVILAERALKPITDELRRRDAAKREEEEWKREEQRRIPTREEASAIMADAGFTPARMQAIHAAPMAMTFAEAEARAEAPPVRHWSETAPPDSPEWRTLRAARAENPLIIEAMAAAKRRADTQEGDQE